MTGDNEAVRHQDLAFRRSDLLVWSKITGPLPLSWDELERAMPALGRGQAVRFLDGRLDDDRLAVLFRILFAYQPCLLAALRPVPEGEIVEMRVSEAAAEGPRLRAVAAQLDGGDARLLSSREGYEVRTYPAGVARTTLQFISRRPTRCFTLLTNGVPLPLDSPFDAYGYATVLTRHIAPVLEGEAILELVIEPPDTMG